MTNWREALYPKPAPQELDHPSLGMEAFAPRTSARAAEAVRDHLLRIYEIEPEPDALLKRTINASTRDLANKWQPRGPQSSWPSAEQMPAVREAIAQSAQDYWKGFHLYKQLHDNPAVREGFEQYASKDAGTLLYRIYMNHVTNTAQARLEATGLDQASALRINAYIIKSTVLDASEQLECEINLQPIMKPSDDDSKIPGQVSLLATYWQRRAPELKAIVDAERDRLKTGKDAQNIR